MVWQITAGALGALAALGLFALGYLIGQCFAARKKRPRRGLDVEQERRALLEQQRAFEELLRYSVEDAYGLRTEDLRGGDGHG